MVCFSRRASGALLILLAVSFCGCGSGGKLVQVTGKVVDGGTPVTISEEDYEEGGSCLEIILIPLDDEGNIATADAQGAYCKPDGTFVIEEGLGIPPMKYRVAVFHRGETNDDSGDLWKNKFDEENSPFVYDITEDMELVIDISKTP
jgi:hypothetical protein